MQPVIVGIDPGTTSAFAILSFDFKVIAVKSRKEYSLAGIIQDIYKHGNPILVGTDKKEVPSFIKEFSQKTGSKIFSPTYDTKKGEKLFIVKDKSFIDLVHNAHETDAMACAIYAYNEYLQLIKKVNAFVEKNNKHDLRDKLLIKVITEGKNIIDAINELETKPVKKNSIVNAEKYPFPDKKELTKEEKEILLLKELTFGLREEMNSLREENAILKQKRVDISRQTKKTISSKENRALELEKQNKLLKKELEKKVAVIRKLDMLIAMSGGSVLLKRIKTLGLHDYNNMKDVLRISKDDILLVDDTSIISENTIKVITGKIKIIVSGNGNQNLLPGFIVLDKIKLELFETKHFCLVEKRNFENELNKMIEKSKKSKEFLIDIVEDYKREKEADKNQ